MINTRSVWLLKLQSMVDWFCALCSILNFTLTIGDISLSVANAVMPTSRWSTTAATHHTVTELSSLVPGVFLSTVASMKCRRHYLVAEVFFFLFFLCCGDLLFMRINPSRVTLLRSILCGNNWPKKKKKKMNKSNVLHLSRTSVL